MLRSRLEHLQGSYRPTVGSATTPEHRRKLEEHVGRPIPDRAWSVIEELGGVALEHCFVDVEDRGEVRVTAFRTGDGAWRATGGPPRSLLAFADGNGGLFCVGVQGSLANQIVYWGAQAGTERSETPPWLAEVVREQAAASLASWREVWRVSPSIEAFLDAIRFRPTPSFESARVRNIAFTVLQGGTCELGDRDGRSIASVVEAQTRWESPAKQMSVLSAEEARQLRDFLDWHERYETHGRDEPLPEFVGPTGLRAMPEEPPPRPSIRETLEGIAEAIRASEPLPERMEISIGQDYEWAWLSLSRRDAPALSLPDVGLFEGERRALRAALGSRGSAKLDDAVAAVAHLLAEPVLRVALRECRQRNPAFRCKVWGPYEEGPIEVPIH